MAIERRFRGSRRETHNEWALAWGCSPAIRGTAFE